METKNRKKITNNLLDSKQKTRKSIIEAAAKQFRDLGYDRTSTLSIAKKAGVSEMTLFRHFGSKNKIFKAVLDQYSGLPQIECLFKEQLSGNLENDLKIIGSMFLKIIIERYKHIKLIMSEAQHFPELNETIKEMPYKLQLEFADYLKRHIKLKKVRDIDPLIMAQVFWGMFFAHGIYLGLLNKKIKYDSLQDELVSKFINIFIYGVLKNNNTRINE